MKRTVSIIMAISLFAAMIFSFAGCADQDLVKKDAINSLSIITATGHVENVNYASIKNDWGRDQNPKFDYTRFKGETAMKLVDEIMSLPDVFGDANDPDAYMIRLDYFDETGFEKAVMKYGYGSFPDNWSKIISYTNDIANGGTALTDSTEIETLNADMLRSECGMTDEMLPEDVTVEKFLEDTGLRYFEVFGFGKFNSDYAVRNYTYDYYDLTSRRITEDSTPSASDKDSLKAYAEENLDSIDSEDEICITGSYNGVVYEIVRFDSFETWKKDTNVDGTEVNFNDDTIDIVYMRDAGCEGMTYGETHYVYVDPSNRFLVITECMDYDVINAFFNR